MQHGPDKFIFLNRIVISRVWQKFSDASIEQHLKFFQNRVLSSKIWQKIIPNYKFKFYVKFQIQAVMSVLSLWIWTRILAVKSYKILFKIWVLTKIYFFKSSFKQYRVTNIFISRHAWFTITEFVKVFVKLEFWAASSE